MLFFFDRFWECAVARWTCRALKKPFTRWVRHTGRNGSSDPAAYFDCTFESVPVARKPSFQTVNGMLGRNVSDPFMFEVARCGGRVKGLSKTAFVARTEFFRFTHLSHSPCQVGTTCHLRGIRVVARSIMS
jgi:hypothetical protein